MHVKAHYTYPGRVDNTQVLVISTMTKSIFKTYVQPGVFQQLINNKGGRD